MAMRDIFAAATDTIIDFVQGIDKIVLDIDVHNATILRRAFVFEGNTNSFLRWEVAEVRYFHPCGNTVVMVQDERSAVATPDLQFKPQVLFALEASDFHI